MLLFIFNSINKLFYLPCLINRGQISSNGCINEKATGKLLSCCVGNLLLSNDTYLKIKCMNINVAIRTLYQLSIKHKNVGYKLLNFI